MTPETLDFIIRVFAAFAAIGALISLTDSAIKFWHHINRNPYV